MKEAHHNVQFPEGAEFFSMPVSPGIEKPGILSVLCVSVVNKSLSPASELRSEGGGSK